MLPVAVVASATATALLTVRADKPRASIRTITQAFFQQLGLVREARKAQVLAYFETAQGLAAGIGDDVVMLSAFHSLRSGAETTDPERDFKLDVHYVAHYGEFYDILFVDRSGLVFYSVLRETDYKSNLFTGPLRETKLARRLPSVREPSFIDYESYAPSDEPAAFFAVPVFPTGQSAAPDPAADPVGWFVLQCPLNKLNAIVSDHRGLGRTGEVYLVNTEQRMVTDSRFSPDPARLDFAVDTPAVSSALSTGAGESLIEDYRGVPVLSSFEPFSVLGANWVIIAEIDEAETVTELYKQHRVSFLQKLLTDSTPRTWMAPGEASIPDRPRKRVDLNEFARAASGEMLETSGVSTCTAITALMPGRFGYLAHIGPSDQVYGMPDTGRNDFLGDMLDRLRHYDVYPFEVRRLEFTIVAVHGASVGGAVDRLLEMGVELAQIRFAFNPQARYANVALSPETSEVLIEWILPDGKRTTTLARRVEDLGSVVKRLAGSGASGSTPDGPRAWVRPAAVRAAVASSSHSAAHSFPARPPYSR